jgi:antiviral helicase SLH1
MLGRAGRPQFDDSGIARIFTQDAKKAFYKHFLHTGFPVESTLHKVLDNHLGAEVSAGTITTKQDALDYLTWTFFFRRLHKNPSYYGLEISADQHNSLEAQTLAQDFMIDLVDKSLGELSESSCITFDTATGEVDATPFGKIMSYYYLAHKTVRYLLSHAKPSPSFHDVLSWMCSATEFDELPVRHNEDLINAELSRNLPLSFEPMGDLPLWGPHVKAFLLLQAYMSRIDLPISDYVGDQISVLDQSIRIIQASIDAMAELGYTAACYRFVNLLQCIKSARWPEDHPLSILPGVDPNQNQNQSQPTNKSDNNNTALPQSLTALTLLPASAISPLPGKLHIPASKSAQFTKATSHLPRLALSISAISPAGVKVSITRKNAPTNADHRIYAPRFPKPQTEGFFLVVCSAKSDGSDGDLLALKRVSWPSNNNQRNNAQFARGGAGGGGGGRNRKWNNSSGLSTSSSVKFPRHLLVSGSVNVRVLSDSYPGMEWVLAGVELDAGAERQVVEETSSSVVKG